MTLRDIAKRPESEQAELRALHRYYRALLQGASPNTRQQLRDLWLRETQCRRSRTSGCA